MVDVAHRPCAHLCRGLTVSGRDDAVGCKAGCVGTWGAQDGLPCRWPAAVLGHLHEGGQEAWLAYSRMRTTIDGASTRRVGCARAVFGAPRHRGCWRRLLARTPRAREMTRRCRTVSHLRPVVSPPAAERDSAERDGRAPARRREMPQPRAVQFLSPVGTRYCTLGVGDAGGQ